MAKVFRFNSDSSTSYIAKTEMTRQYACWLIVNHIDACHLKTFLLSVMRPSTCLV